MNPPRKECVAYQNMVNLFVDMLETVWKDMLTKAGGTSEAHRAQAALGLPEVIWVFRDGISDGQLRECYSKEVNGIQRACRWFSYKNQIKDPTKKKRKDWVPKIQFIVAQKRIIDRFGVVTPNGVDDPKKATVVYDHVLSNDVWDFLAWFNTGRKNRPLRYIVVLDELRLARDHDAVYAMFQFLFGLTYTYPFNIPFATGNTNQPGSIKLAKHYSENWSQMILSTDQDLSLLETNPKLNRPQLSLRNDPVPMVNE